MSEHAQALGLGTTIKHGGKEYHLSPWTVKTMGEFELFVKRSAWDAFAEVKDYLDPGEALEARKALLAMGAAGEFNFGSPAVQAALTTLPGIKRSLLLLLRVQHPEVDEAAVEAIVAEQLEEIMAAMGDANADPTRPAAGPVETPSA